MMRAAVLGRPIAHSLSPTLHMAAYRALGLDWTYEAIDVGPRELAAFMGACDSSWAGLSLTMPLKVVVLDLLDEADELVSLTDSANTVVFSSGRRVGHNTDVYGIVAALREDAPTEIADARTATVLGAGATARSALVALSDLGIREVSLVARRREAAEDLARRAGAMDLDARPWSWTDPVPALRADVVISALPPHAADPLASLAQGAHGVLLDVAYSPWPSRLADVWHSIGGKVVGGLSMLTWQAAEQVRLMTGLPAPVDAMRRAVAG